MTKDRIAVLEKFPNIVDEFIETKGDSIETQTCPTCNHSQLYTSQGVIYCGQCYTECGQTINIGPEWRNFDDGINNSRCGHPVNPLLIESSYGSNIGSLWGINGMTRLKYQRLKQLISWHSMPYQERGLKKVFDMISYWGNLWGLTTNITDFSKKLYHEVMEKQADSESHRLTRGDNRTGLIAACIYYACKDHGIDRSPMEIAKICDTDVSDVTRGLKLFYELMRDSHLLSFQTNISKYITKYDDLVMRYCRKLKLQANIRKKILQLTDRIAELKILSKNTPQSMVCASIYYASIAFNLQLTKKHIAIRCGITIPTISKSYNKLLPHTPMILGNHK